MIKLNKRKTVTRSEMCSKLIIKRLNDVKVSLLLTLNMFHVLYDELYSEERKESNKLNRFQIEVFFLPNLSPSLVPRNIGPSTLSFLSIYAQGVLTGFYGIVLCF